MQLNYKVHGTGEPVVILHGLFGSLDNWHSISLKLAQQFQVFTLDQRNHGASPHSPEMTYPLMAADLEEFLDLRKISCAGVLGHSMGGKTAMQFALLYPRRVSRLIVVDIAPRAYPPRHDQVLCALLSLKLETFQTRKEIEEALAPAIPDLALRQFLLKNLARNPQQKFHWKLGLHEIAAAYPKLSEALAGGQPFQGPTLFLRGEQSDYLTESDLGNFRSLFPQAELRTIPGAGHLVHAEEPEAFLREVTGFLPRQPKVV